MLKHQRVELKSGLQYLDFIRCWHVVHVAYANVIGPFYIQIQSGAVYQLLVCQQATICLQSTRSAYLCRRNSPAVSPQHVKSPLVIKQDWNTLGDVSPKLQRICLKNISNNSRELSLPSDVTEISHTCSFMIMCDWICSQKSKWKLVFYQKRGLKVSS